MNYTATTSTASQNYQQDNDGILQEEEEGERARCEWDFTLTSTITPPSTSSSSSDVIGSVEVDPTDRLLATAGIARKIRIYTLSSTLGPSLDFFISTPAKLSTLRWAPPHLTGGPHIIGAADYDGVISEYDLERRLAVSERDEHSGRRVWSMDYSPSSSFTAASCSDDCTAQIWDRRCGPSSVAVISRTAPVCSVEFDKAEEAAAGFHIGLGCADKKAYVYDLRNISAGPVTTFSGHVRTVTYVRFSGGGRAVTSGVDGRHRMWEVENGREVRVYRGHVNERSFVGMDVYRGHVRSGVHGDGLIGCGSESGEVYVYDMRWGEPIWVEGFGVGGGYNNRDEREEGGGGNFGGGGPGFVSAVCWREVREEEDECGLVAGGSNGVVKIFSGRRRRVMKD